MKVIIIKGAEKFRMTKKKTKLLLDSLNERSVEYSDNTQQQKKTKRQIMKIRQDARQHVK
jgi:hypothetical protein